ERKRPERSSFYAPEGTWAWWVLFGPQLQRGRVKAREIPEPLWRRLPPKIDWFTGYRAYPTRAAAEYALRQAWGRLTPKQREAVLAWHRPAALKKRPAR